MNPHLLEAEKECQHFGFTSKDVVLKVVEILQGLMESLVDSVLTKLDFMGADDHIQSKQDLIQYFNENIERNIPSLERIIKEYMNIPKNVLLPGEEEQVQQYSSIYEETIAKELKKSEYKALAMERLGRRLSKFLIRIMQDKDANDTFPFYESELNNMENCSSDMTSILKVLPDLVENISSTISRLDLNEQ